MTTKAESGEKEFAFDDWLAEGINGVRAEGCKKKDEIVPEAFRTHIKESRTHIRTARKEFLMALRSLVDAALEKVEAKPEPPKKATKIKVE